MNIAECINVNTLLCLSMVKDLAEKIQNGIKPFEECTLDTKDDYIFYYEDEGRCKIVLDKCVDEIHHDIICDYDYYCNGLCDVEVMDLDNEDPDNEPYILISFPNDDTALVIESDGQWYMMK